MAARNGSLVTADTNIAVYALVKGDKAARARRLLAAVDFLSVQVLNEYMNVARRKLLRNWTEISEDVDLLLQLAGDVRPITLIASLSAVRLAARYKLAPYDAVMVAVALANDASTLYSEDMQHGFVIDGRLTILNPFCETDA